MFVRILGTAAGGGYPQWNCACRLCRGARNPAKPGIRRFHESIAVSVTGKNWYLINASPDVRLQIEATDVLHPGPGIRETPIRGVLLSDGELDHTTGLLILHEGAPKLDIYATAAVQSLLMSAFPIRHILKSYAAFRWVEINSREPFLLDADNLCVQAFSTGEKKPRYAGGTQLRGEQVIGYRLEDANTNRVVVYAPRIESWSNELATQISQSECAIVDGTFYTDNEMVSIGISPRTAQALGHMPISGKNGLAERLAMFPNVRKILTHVNNTNPMLDETSPERMALAGNGIEVGYDGMLLEF